MPAPAARTGPAARSRCARKEAWGSFPLDNKTGARRPFRRPCVRSSIGAERGRGRRNAPPARRQAGLYTLRGGGQGLDEVEDVEIAALIGGHKHMVRQRG